MAQWVEAAQQYNLIIAYIQSQEPMSMWKERADPPQCVHIQC